MSDPSDIRSSSVSSAPTPKTVSVTFRGNTLVKVIAIVIVAIIAFWLGVAYESQHKTVTASTNGGLSSGGYGQFRTGGGFGTVSAISSSSITVEDSRTGTNKTYTITSSTKITDDGQTAPVSSIADGDKVVVIPSSSDSSDAASILVNPSFGGFGGNSSGSSTSGGSTTTGSATTQ